MNKILLAHIEEMSQDTYSVWLSEYDRLEEGSQVAVFSDRDVAREFVRRWNKEEKFKIDVATNLAALNKPLIL